MSTRTTWITGLAVGFACLGGALAARAQTVSCCFTNGTCSDLPASQCVAFGGAPGPAGSTCAAWSCTAPQACCAPSGACQMLPPMQCAQVGGYPGGMGSNCNNNLCTERPCCLPNGTCIFASPQYCDANGGTSGPIGTACPTVCPTQDDCRPKSDGSACEDTVCPDGASKCKPKKVIITAAGPKVLECDCAGQDECHVELVAGAPPACVGSCPPGQICRQITTQTPSGIVLECRCEDDPTQCAPTPDRLRCLNSTCPATSDKCQPKCVTYVPATNSFQIDSCECTGADECHVDTSGLANGVPPHCVGVCPPGYTCKEEVTHNADGSWGLCCKCDPVPQGCQPNTTFTGCTTTACPIAGQTCIPKEITKTAAGNFFVTKCDCDDPDTCHISYTPGTLPACVAGCPDPTKTCTQRVTQGPNNSTVYSCECVCDPAKCDDGNPCTIDSCDPATGNCVHVSNPDCRACCFPNGPCQNLPPSVCQTQGGIPQPAGTTCATVSCPPPTYPKFSQPPTQGQDDIPSNWDVNTGQPRVVLADDFQSDGRPIVLVRWWGSYLNPEFKPVQYGGAGTPPFQIDGWLISFHTPITVNSTSTPSTLLGLYFAPAGAVAIRPTTIPPCDNHQVFEYEIRISDCCLLCANPDPRSNLVPAQCDAFNEQHCFVYDLDIQAVVGRSWSKAASGCPCLPVSTLNNAQGKHFWGWHSTTIERGKRQAVRTVTSVQGVNCPTYGPWVYAQHLCTFLKRPQMSFELLTNNPNVPDACPQACCLPNGACVDVPTATCLAIGGTPKGIGTSCAGTKCPKPPVIVKWTSVRSHSGIGPLPIVLNPIATGNGALGPTVETRTGGIQLVEVDFDQVVNLVNPAAVTVTGRTTSYPGGVMGGPVPYVPTSVVMVSPTRMALTFGSGQLPDRSCYNFWVGGSVQNTAAQGLVGDVDCNARSLVGDVNMNGEVNLGDTLFAKSKIGTPVASVPEVDANLSGGLINLGDALFVKSNVLSPPKKALCP